MTRGRLRVVDPGPLTLTVDAGRRGMARWGVAPGGPFDRAASDRANALVGNDPAAATLEVLLGPLVLEATRAAVVAVTGPAAVRVGDLPVEVERPFAVPAGARLTVRAVGGARVWLAVAGGVDVPPVLGSRSRDTLAGLGPSPLAAGDVLPVGDAISPDRYAAAGQPSAVAVQHRVGASGSLAVELPVLPPPRPETLVPTAWDDLLRCAWTVAAECDRVAVRLRGEPALAAPEASAASEGLVAGAVQLPPSGQPLVFGPDHPLTGGYPVIGVVTSSGLGELAQLRPGDGVRFVPR